MKGVLNMIEQSDCQEDWDWKESDSSGECCPRNGQQLELSCVYLIRNRNDPEIDTEPTIELLCIVVAGNGVRVCHHVD